jgi:hypothetical protein
LLSELQRQIAEAVRAGASLDEIEEELISPAPADDDQKAALWLFAQALQRLRIRDRARAPLGR